MLIAKFKCLRLVLRLGEDADLLKTDENIAF